MISSLPVSDPELDCFSPIPAGNPNTSSLSWKLLYTNTGWNLLGLALPLLLGLLTIPILLRSLGTDRFGLLTLTWTLLGYASLFDLGMGRAITSALTRRLPAADTSGLARLVWASVLITVGFGLLGGGVLFGLGVVLIRRTPGITAAIGSEALPTLYILSFCAPLVAASAALRGVIEAFQDFKQVSAVRLITGVLTFVGPLAILPWSRTLPAAVATVGAARLAGCILTIFYCRRHIPGLLKFPSVSHALIGELRELLTFGAWISVSNIIGPLIANIDRVILTAKQPLHSLALYSIPAETLTKLLILPSALVGVLFPAFSNLTNHQPDSSVRLYSRSLLGTAALLFPIIFTAMLFSRELLTLWVGSSVATGSFRVSQIIAFGVYLNALGYIHLTYLQASNRAASVARIQMIEALVYIPSLYFLVILEGITGAAIAWTARMALDTLLLAARAKGDLAAMRPSRDSTTVIALIALLLGCLAAGNLQLSWRALIFGFLASGYAITIFRHRRSLLQGLRVP